MEFWGAKVKAGECLKVEAGFHRVIHLSQATLGKGNNKDPVYVYCHVDDKKYVLAILSRKQFPTACFDLSFEKEFQLSHSMAKGFIHFMGYKTPDLDGYVETPTETPTCKKRASETDDVVPAKRAKTEKVLPTENFFCPYCNKNFSSAMALQDHSKAKHG